MAIALGRFGSIFKYKDGYFVYFAISPEKDRLFGAKILNEEDTELLQSMSTRYEKRPNHPLRGSLNLCFVILTSENFNGQAAAFAGTGDNVDVSGEIEFVDRTLNDDDIKELKKTILEDPAIPSLLAKLIREISA